MKTDQPFDKQIFKLATGEQVGPEDVENLILKTCHYVKFVTLTDGGTENHIALIFPEKKLMDNPDYHKTPDEGCFCPRNLTELGRCLSGCLQRVNKNLEEGSQKISSSIIVNADLNKMETKPSPENLSKILKDALQHLIEEESPNEEEIYYIQSL